MFTCTCPVYPPKTCFTKKTHALQNGLILIFNILFFTVKKKTENFLQFEVVLLRLCFYLQVDPSDTTVFQSSTNTVADVAEKEVSININKNEPERATTPDHSPSTKERLRKVCRKAL